jgi:hypothetical protein
MLHAEDLPEKQTMHGHFELISLTKKKLATFGTHNI